MTVPEKQWQDLTWEQKREQRFARWLSPPGYTFDSPDAGARYKEKVNRFIQAITLQESDRVPVILPSSNYPAYYSGYTLYDIMHDYDKLYESWIRFLQEFDLDTLAAPALTFPARVLEKVGNNLQKWPGHGLPADTTMSQFVEGEYMLADEYEPYLHNSLEYFIRCYLPRAWDVFKPFGNLEPNIAGYDMPFRILMLCGQPEFQEAFRTLAEASAEYMKWFKVVVEIEKRIIASGVPALRGSMTSAPFDHFGDVFRGTRGIFADIYRQPDRLLSAMEENIPRQIAKVVESGKRALSPLVFMPLHKGDDTFMSEKQFLTFYWPQLKKLLLGMIEEGFVPFLFAEGKYNTRLELINELPRGSVIWHFDQTDMFNAKKILGGSACLVGNVPSSLVCTGTADAVKARCLELIEVCGEGGGYILAGGASVDRCNPDNLRAMLESVREFKRT